MTMLWLLMSCCWHHFNTAMRVLSVGVLRGATHPVSQSTAAAAAVATTTTMMLLCFKRVASNMLSSRFKEPHENHEERGLDHQKTASLFPFYAPLSVEIRSTDPCLYDEFKHHVFIACAIV